MFQQFSCRYIVTCMRDYRWVFGFDDCFYCTLYIHTARDYMQLQRYRWFTHFTVHRYTLVVSWQRIYHSLTVTSNNTWSLLFKHNSFLAIILQLPVPKTRFHSVPLLPAGWRPETRHFISRLLGRVFWLCPFITPRHGPHKKLFVVKEAYLLVRCLAMDVLVLHAYASRERVYRAVTYTSQYTLI
jgi:hypothetical protein